MRSRFIPMLVLVSAACVVEEPTVQEEQAYRMPVVQAEPTVAEDHEPSVAWDQVRVQLTRAIESGHRGSGHLYNAQEWLRDMQSVVQRTQMFGLIILGEDGSYSDLVLPSLGHMINEYREAGIDPKTNDQNRLRIARGMVADLLFVLTKLDEQIKSNHDCTERLKTSDVTSSVQAALCPGFYSTQVEVQLDARDWNVYHLSERKQLETVGAELKRATTLNADQFWVILQNLPERIRPYFE